MMPPAKEFHPDWRRRAAERLDGDEQGRLETLWGELEPPAAEHPPADLVGATMERVRAEAETKVAPWHAMGWRPSLAGAALVAALCVGLALGLVAGTVGPESEDVLAAAPVSGSVSESVPEGVSEVDLYADAEAFGPSSAGLADAWWNAWSSEDAVRHALPEPDLPSETSAAGGAGEGGA